MAHIQFLVFLVLNLQKQENPFFSWQVVEKQNTGWGLPHLLYNTKNASYIYTHTYICQIYLNKTGVGEICETNGPFVIGIHARDSLI